MRIKAVMISVKIGFDLFDEAGRRIGTISTEDADSLANSISVQIVDDELLEGQKNGL